ncbi:bestrophin family ion channel [soil metagenome]
MKSLLQMLWPPLPVWKRLDLGVFAVVTYALVVHWTFTYFQVTHAQWIGEFGIVNAVLLGVLLGFRNKEAYDRWWEARKLWGQLINDSRNIAVKVKTFVNPPEEERRQVGKLVLGFAITLKHHLQGQHDLHRVPGFEAEPVSGRHLPSYISTKLYALLHHWHRDKTITDMEFLALDTHFKSLLDVCGACERIQKSPVPLSYRSLLRHGTILYLMTAPWFLAGDFGYWSAAIVGMIAYFLLGTELTAEDIEDPFGHDGDDLALSLFCETIRKGQEEILEVSMETVK